MRAALCLATIALWCTCFVENGRAQHGTVPDRIAPVDEGGRDASFAAFRARLLESARADDIKAVLAAVDPRVRSSRGTGLSVLYRRWNIRQSPKAFLRELEEVLSLGGRLTDSAKFVAPYSYTEFPDLPPSQLGLYAVIVKPRTAVHSTQDMKSPTIATLNDEVVKLTFEGDRSLRVALPDGKEGWVPSNAARSPADTYVVFKKRQGQWKIVEFNGGIG